MIFSVIQVIWLASTLSNEVPQGQAMELPDNNTEIMVQRVIRSSELTNSMRFPVEVGDGYNTYIVPGSKEAAKCNAAIMSVKFPDPRLIDNPTKRTNWTFLTVPPYYKNYKDLLIDTYNLSAIVCQPYYDNTYFQYYIERQGHLCDDGEIPIILHDNYTFSSILLERLNTTILDQTFWINIAPANYANDNDRPYYRSYYLCYPNQCRLPVDINKTPRKYIRMPNDLYLFMFKERPTAEELESYPKVCIRDPKILQPYCDSKLDMQYDAFMSLALKSQEEIQRAKNINPRFRRARRAPWFGILLAPAVEALAAKVNTLADHHNKLMDELNKTFVGLTFQGEALNNLSKELLQVRRAMERDADDQRHINLIQNLQSASNHLHTTINTLLTQYELAFVRKDPVAIQMLFATHREVLDYLPPMPQFEDLSVHIGRTEDKFRITFYLTEKPKPVMARMRLYHMHSECYSLESIFIQHPVNFETFHFPPGTPISEIVKSAHPNTYQASNLVAHLPNGRQFYVAQDCGYHSCRQDYDRAYITPFEDKLLQHEFECAPPNDTLIIASPIGFARKSATTFVYPLHTCLSEAPWYMPIMNGMNCFSLGKVARTICANDRPYFTVPKATKNPYFDTMFVSTPRIPYKPFTTSSKMQARVTAILLQKGAIETLNQRYGFEEDEEFEPMNFTHIYVSNETYFQMNGSLFNVIGDIGKGIIEFGEGAINTIGGAFSNLFSAIGNFFGGIFKPFFDIIMYTAAAVCVVFILCCAGYAMQYFHYLQKLCPAKKPKVASPAVEMPVEMPIMAPKPPRPPPSFFERYPTREQYMAERDRIFMQYKIPPVPKKNELDMINVYRQLEGKPKFLFRPATIYGTLSSEDEPRLDFSLFHTQPRQPRVRNQVQTQKKVKHIYAHARSPEEGNYTVETRLAEPPIAISPSLYETPVTVAGPVE